MTEYPESPSKSLIDSLCNSLIRISQNPHQHIENPRRCSQRASVSLIVRIRPHFNQWPEDEISKSDSNDRLDVKTFFNLPWVQGGDPEIAFIKRAARDGDRWTSHIALPGGKRDPGDLDDKSVAIRETAEEIGLDLTSSNALYIGNLLDRLVRTAWGTLPIIILCPFVFLWTKAASPSLRLQPGEVASVHWVPIRTLLSPSSRTYEYVNISDRLARKGGLLRKIALRCLLGLMQFSAISLSPSESLYCSSSTEFFPGQNSIQSERKNSLISRFYDWSLLNTKEDSSRHEPLLLWGLTLGILVDFIDELPPHNAINLWSYPTFTNYDARLIISVLTISLRQRNKGLLQAQSNMTDPSTAYTEIVGIQTKDASLTTKGQNDHNKMRQEYKLRNRSDAVGVMLDGYYDMVRRGAIIAISLRTIGTFSLLFLAIRQYKKLKL